MYMKEGTAKEGGRAVRFKGGGGIELEQIRDFGFSLQDATR